jgi:hypothetical protein
LNDMVDRGQITILLVSGGYAAKATELRDRVAELKLTVDVADRVLDEQADIAVKTFELSQRLSEKWLTADSAAKSRCLN